MTNENKTQETKHAPTPWRIDGGTNNRGEQFIWTNGNYFGGHAIACVYDRMKDAKENAEFIVRAVNSHEALLESLKDVLAHSELQAGIIREKAVKAIAQAERK